MKTLCLLALPLLALATPLTAQEEVPPRATPGSVVAEADDAEWVAIAPQNLLVMDLAPDAIGTPRRVVIQLMQAPLSQPWVENIRTLARAQYWDGSSVNRVQDNYVVQWGQPDEDVGGTEKPVPDGLNVVPEECYEIQFDGGAVCEPGSDAPDYLRGTPHAVISARATRSDDHPLGWHGRDPYAEWVQFHDGWPIASRQIGEQPDGAPVWSSWPTHCYGMVGVGRDVSPDTGDGSQLYTVIGHAPRHLDRNIALVGRIIEGMEHLTTLPRGTGPLGFYERVGELVPILSARIAADMQDAPAYEYLSTESESFERYIAVRANRLDSFYNIPAGGVDICNVPVPIRSAGE
ncbi:peptidylprolyl isomerase [Aurantiacibacter aquimixticola]|uniref:Peptidylprolyl isomerase n=1 Tax=Aurantiacibacter aquimixticola TaxID=1958945 RepID=A0A419RW23_9SPHN|nr:peptidylprolyl isomerase [Aurantiacibacter aquimixticola]RJY10000.1 peptidylprolyl isomerase [Aurantiacibacter aquimixticola]